MPTHRPAGRALRRISRLAPSRSSLRAHRARRGLRLFFALCLCASALGAQPKAKYVFYFIGDGMGVNQVNGAETFLAARQGRIGTQPLCFPSFPYVAMVTTQSATNGVTDSAAGGTALATGHKTRNGAIGVRQDLTTPLRSIAYAAKEAGAAVGIATSVSPDHATPAVFYAHAPNRRMYHAIGRQLPASGFDFFAGSDFLQPAPAPDATPADELHRLAADSGYTLLRGYPDFQQHGLAAGKVLLLQPAADTCDWPATIPYAIDRRPGNLSLPQITRAGTQFLASRGRGFFFMVEGGMIDMACHANDAATYVRELLDLDSCVRLAYDFYLQHPDSTLIVVTADHETGGLVLGRGPYELHLDRLAAQQTSLWRYARHLAALRRKGGAVPSWDDVRRDLRENFGFGDALALTKAQEAALKAAYDAWADAPAIAQSGVLPQEQSLSAAAGRVMDEQTGIAWTSGGHSDGYVGVYAVGAGADRFHGRIDNTQIPSLVARAAGWNLE